MKKLLPALKWENICFSVNTGFFMRQSKILHDIDLELHRGKILGLIGANGAGKTTTLSIGAGLIRPYQGSVTVHGIPISSIKIKNRIGYLAEVQYPFRHLRLVEWLFLLGKLSGMDKNELNQQVEKILNVFELEELNQKFLNILSKGQLQRVSLAQTLLHKPDILILDEPMSGLDAYWRRQVTAFLKRFKNQGGAVVFSSHVLTDIKEIADSIACIEKGRIKWISDTDSLPDSLTPPEEIKGFEEILFSKEYI